MRPMRPTTDDGFPRFLLSLPAQTIALLVKRHWYLHVYIYIYMKNILFYTRDVPTHFYCVWLGMVII